MTNPVTRESLTSRNVIRHVLETFEIHASKRFGQNFLADEGSRKKIIEFAAIPESGNVLEIGPGLGALTTSIAPSAKRMIAVEVDRRISQFLQSDFFSWPQTFTLLNADALEQNLEELFPDSPCFVVSNVPYSISSEVILWLIKNREHVTGASLLFQREFTERLLAKPGTKEYGSLTVLLELLADRTSGPVISGACFFPQADVESKMLGIRFLSSPRYDVCSIELFEKVVRASMANRRKTICNNLRQLLPKHSREEVEKILESAGIDPGARGESLGCESYVALTNQLNGKSPTP